MKIPVLDTNQNPLAPCHPARARQLLREGGAAIFRRFPFTLILKEAKCEIVTPTFILKIDPGSRFTGIAVVNQTTGQIVFACEIEHRGQQIKQALDARRSLRRSRRNRQTRYRKDRFLNRTRKAGWLPPSLESRIANVLTWVARLMRIYPIKTIAVESVKFDTQLMQNPEISGVEYQQGELAGYEVREYLLEKWGRACAYCGKEDVPLQVEHLVPKARGGTNRVSNLTIACGPCNLKKGTMTAAEFGFPGIQQQARKPLKDAAAVNATRNALRERLMRLGLPVETGSGSLTKFNRTKRGLPKTHWLDAACVGHSTPEKLAYPTQVLQITATGHGSRQMCQTDKYGFPIRRRTRNKTYRGWQTGDIVRAVIPKGKHQGVINGRLTIRQRPTFHIGGKDVHHKHLTRLFRRDGFGFNLFAPVNTITLAHSGSRHPC